MTLAGTRPPTVDEWDKYELHHRARLATKPGLTGMWQVSGRSKTVWKATKVVAVFSFMIEFTQLLFHLGTFQISDLSYNTLGGVAGGIIYYLGYCRKGKRKNKIRNRG